MKSVEKHKKEKPIFSIAYLITIAFIVLITLLVNIYVVGIVIIYGNSMEPTLNSWDIVVVNKLTQEYHRLDVVIIDTSQETIIKRIIGMPGETIQIKDGYVYINGEQIDDVLDEKTKFAGTAFDPLTLGEDEYFVLGDNRENSIDSRYKEVGPIKHEQIVGYVIIPN